MYSPVVQPFFFLIRKIVKFLLPCLFDTDRLMEILYLPGKSYDRPDGHPRQRSAKKKTRHQEFGYIAKGRQGRRIDMELPRLHYAVENFSAYTLEHIDEDGVQSVVLDKHKTTAPENPR